ncbi:alpha/beta hydrolase [Amphibiibacter pelophylacis]|uniref:Alpha/beta hydrolase n=1 Tax=Amphibiibacter pelophylacis TaxID=1799477 RepID=A0ACC6P0E0_9BURK
MAHRPVPADPAAVLTPAMQRVLQAMARAQTQPLHQLGVDAARAFYNRGAEVLDLPRDPRVSATDLTVAQRPARLYRPPQDTALADGAGAAPVLLYLHGGGFVLGGLETHDSLCRQLALRSGWAVLALDYRLAPEHRFPAAVDDARAALAALVAGEVDPGLSRTRLAVGGDSAGGTLAAVLALMARDARWPLALQLLITPGTTAHQDTASHRRYASGFLLDADAITWFFDQYLSHDEQTDWRFAPLRAEDHEGVAPACLLLAECDPLIDEGLAYGDTLRASGVAVELDLQAGVTHDFIKMGRALPQALVALDVAGAALRRAFDAT